MQSTFVNLSMRYLCNLICSALSHHQNCIYLHMHFFLFDNSSTVKALFKIFRSIRIGNRYGIFSWEIADVQK